MTERTYVLHGENFSTLEEFYKEWGKVFAPQGTGQVKDLNDVDTLLLEAIDAPEERIILVWKSWALSKERLGYSETLKELEKWIKECQPADGGLKDLDMAKRNEGLTVFDWIVELIQGREHAELRLE